MREGGLLLKHLGWRIYQRLLVWLYFWGETSVLSGVRLPRDPEALLTCWWGNFNQVKRIAEAEERKLEKEGREERFSELFQKLQYLRALEEISESEIRAWTGPTHYVSLQHVINEESATTSFRIVTNSSLKSPGNPYTLNNILAKGPNMLVDPYKILIRYRHYLRSLISDITKAC